MIPTLRLVTSIASVTTYGALPQLHLNLYATIFRMQFRIHYVHYTRSHSFFFHSDTMLSVAFLYLGILSSFFVCAVHVCFRHLTTPDVRFTPSTYLETGGTRWRIGTRLTASPPDLHRLFLHFLFFFCSFLFAAPIHPSSAAIRTARLLRCDTDRTRTSELRAISRRGNAFGRRCSTCTPTRVPDPYFPSFKFQKPLQIKPFHTLLNASLPVLDGNGCNYSYGDQRKRKYSEFLISFRAR